MKQYIVFSLSLLLLLSFSSCSHKKASRQERVEEFRSTLNKEDTTEMLKLADDAMELLKNRQYDQVLANLCEYDSVKGVRPLSKETAKKYMNMFRMFPVREYQRMYYSFQLEGCNDVKYEVVWATAEQAGTKEPAKTAYMFNPVKVDGVWKLCVKTADDEIDQNLR